MQTTLRDIAGQLAPLLSRLTTDGGDGNFVAVLYGDSYIQFASGKGATSVMVEAVSNHYLPQHAHLDQAAAARLGSAGFAAPCPDHENFQKYVSAADPDWFHALASEAVQLLQEVYGVADSDVVRLKSAFEERWRPENPELLQALVAYEHDDSEEASMRVFVGLLNGQLLVPVAPDDGDAVQFLRGPDGTPALPACTDEKALAGLMPDGFSFFVMPGHDLFPWAKQNGVPQVVVNANAPGTCVLSTQQIEALAGAAASASKKS